MEEGWAPHVIGSTPLAPTRSGIVGPAEAQHRSHGLEDGALVVREPNRSAGRRVFDREATRVRVGFRDGNRGTHASRTIMLVDLGALFDVCPETASRKQYRAAIVEENVLGRRTHESRRVTAQKLSELYGLDPDLPVFRGLRRMWSVEPAGRPLLALLCACARDPLLRRSAATILPLALGDRLPVTRFAADLSSVVGDRFSEKTLATCGRRIASSWSQAGFLEGGAMKTRTRPEVTPATAAYALFLAHLEGDRGQRLFATGWARLLDRSEVEVTSLVSAAARRGLLDYRATGAVVEVRFGDWLTRDEQEMVREQG
jgi:hypothetical protein